MPLESSQGLLAYNLPSEITKQSWAKRKRPRKWKSRESWGQRRKEKKRKRFHIPEDISEVLKP
jgi:hypothetical protein